MSHHVSCQPRLVTHLDEVLDLQEASLLLLADYENLLEEEELSRCFRADQPEVLLGEELAIRRQVVSAPVDEHGLHFLDAHGVLVLPLHLVRPLRHFRHALQRALDDVTTAVPEVEIIEKSLKKNCVDDVM